MAPNTLSIWSRRETEALAATTCSRIRAQRPSRAVHDEAALEEQKTVSRIKPSCTSGPSLSSSLRKSHAANAHRKNPATPWTRESSCFCPGQCKPCKSRRCDHAIIAVLVAIYSCMSLLTKSPDGLSDHMCKPTQPWTQKLPDREEISAFTFSSTFIESINDDDDMELAICYLLERL